MIPHSRVMSLALSITKKYGLNQCDDCAKELKDVFKKKGISGQLLTLSTKLGNDFIVMKNPNFILPFPTSGDCAISNTGQHFGIQVGEYVFDNIFKEGILETQWVSQFDCRCHQFDSPIKKPF